MAEKIDVTVEQSRTGNFDVRVTPPATEEDWDKLELVLQKLQADGLILYCGRQNTINGACRFIMTAQLARKLRRTPKDRVCLVLARALRDQLNK